MPDVIRVLCIDDHAFLAEGLQTRFAMEDDLEFAGWLSSTESLATKVREDPIDIVLLDIEMPGPDPFEALADLQRSAPDVRAIMLSAYIRDNYLNAALNAGAWGYVSKSDRPEDVIAAIRKVHGGEFAFGPKVLERCTPPTPGAGAKQPATALDGLTPREFQILRMIGKGMSRSEIAKAVHRSPKTIDNHRAAIMNKLGIHDRVALARYAISEGIVDLE